MEWLAALNHRLNAVVWGTPMLVLMVGAGVYLSVRTGFVQLRRFGRALGTTLGRLFAPRQAGQGEVTPFQAMATALAGTVGTGNIAGVTWAVTRGGPGAVFWMWVAALLGMCTKYCEIVLAVHYRVRSRRGEWLGGPMYYICGGLGQGWHWLAGSFALFGALAAFGIGNAVQVGNITDAVGAALQSFGPAGAALRPSADLAVGIGVAFVVLATALGGAKRIGSVAEKLVPFMSLLYIAGGLAVVAANARQLGPVFEQILQGAFCPAAVTGGLGGIALRDCIGWGLKRGVFSNEAGLGSAPMAHAAARVEHPAQQGLYGIFEVFADTVVLCTLTALTLLVSGIDLHYGVQGTTALNMAAFATLFGQKAAALFLGVAIGLFALSSVLSWALYGGCCVEFLLGPKARRRYLWVFAGVCVVGATMDLDLAWEIADTLNGLMALPNLVALFGLAGVAARLTREYFSRPKRK